MSEIIAYVMMLVAVGFVLQPLFHMANRYGFKTPQNNATVHQWLYRKRVAAEIIADLEFDRQTGKLNDTDYEELKARQAQLIAEMDEKIRRSQPAHDDALTKKLLAEIDEVRKRAVNNRPSTCPKCGIETAKEANYCAHCGAKLR